MSTTELDILKNQQAFIAEYSQSEKKVSDKVTLLKQVERFLSQYYNPIQNKLIVIDDFHKKLAELQELPCSIENAFPDINSDNFKVNLLKSTETDKQKCLGYFTQDQTSLKETAVQIAQLQTSLLTVTKQQIDYATVQLAQSEYQELMTMVKTCQTKIGNQLSHTDVISLKKLIDVKLESMQIPGDAQQQTIDKINSDCETIQTILTQKIEKFDVLLRLATNTSAALTQHSIFKVPQTTEAPETTPTTRLD